MKKRLLLFLTLFILSSLFTGCWSKKELNELAIASAIGIDKSENGYLITVQLLNPGEIARDKSSGSKVPILTFRNNGKTIFEALQRLTIETPRRIYLAHIRVLYLVKS